MNEIIYRQDAIDSLANMYCKSDSEGYVWIIRSDAWAEIDALPSVQLEEYKKGKWIEIKYTFHHKCSNCGWINNADSGYNFCPNCGADMRGKQNEN